MIFVTIGKQHHCYTAIFKFYARAALSSTRAQYFYIAYNTLHYTTFRMSGRSFLCDLWFSQTLRHKNYIYYYLPKTKKFGCVGGET